MEDEPVFDWGAYIDQSATLDVDELYRKGVQYPREILDAVRRVVPRDRVRSALELGCSAGMFLVLIEKTLGKRLLKIGVDINPKITSYTLLDTYIVGSAFDAQVPSRCDLVCSFGLIEHFPREARRALFQRHFALSNRYVAIGFPNTNYSLRYAIIRLRHDLFGGSRHYHIHNREFLQLARDSAGKVLFAGHLGNNSFLQSRFKAKSAWAWSFLRDYYLIVMQKTESHDGLPSVSG